MVSKRKRLNLKLVTNNIAEAVEQLNKLQELATNGKLHSGFLQVGLWHAQRHPNLAWNVRYVRTSVYRKLTTNQLERWSKFPPAIVKF
jgi:hypothetical protein